MTSQPMRDQVEDHLITPKNAALLIIDYQPPQVSSIVSMDHRILVSSIVAAARLAKVFALPIVLSTVNVKTGLSGPTIHQQAEVLAGIEALDRTTINAWEDEEFVTAVKATGRKKLIMAALWTEACSLFPRSTPCAKGTRSTRWWTRSAAPPSRPTGPGSSASCRLAHNPQAWFS